MESGTLFSAADIWPEDPSVDQAHDASELRKYVFCGVTAVVSLLQTITSSTPGGKCWKRQPESCMGWPTLKVILMLRIIAKLSG